MLTLSNIRIFFFFESANNINNVACSSKEVYAKTELIMEIIYIYIYIYMHTYIHTYIGIKTTLKFCCCTVFHVLNMRQLYDL